MSEFKKIEWRRIGIEAAAIVASILLAFWIDAWWENRKEDSNHVAQLQSFEQELVENIERIESHLKQISEHGEALDNALHQLSNSEGLSKSAYKDIGVGLNFLSDPLATSVYNEVLSSGTLRRIQTPGLKSAIGEYDRSIDLLAIYADESWAIYRDVMVPLLIRYVPISELGWTEPQSLTAESRSATAPTWPSSMSLRELDSAETWNTLYLWKVMQTETVNARIETKTTIEELLVHLRVELQEFRD